MEVLTEEQRELITPLMIRLINSVPINIAILDLNGNFLIKNRLMERIPISMVQQLNNSDIKQMFSIAIKGKESIKRLEIEINGEKREFIVVCSPIKDTEEKTRLVMLVLTETTKEKRKIEEIETINEILKTSLGIEKFLIRNDIDENTIRLFFKELKRNRYFGCIHLLILSEKRKKLFFLF